MDIALKIAPPRIARDSLLRERLALGNNRFDGVPVLAIVAPAGFGKTSLLAQWRRESLARGAMVAWLTAGEADDPARFLQGLALSIRAATLRPTFAHTLVDAVEVAGLEPFAVLLTEIQQVAAEMVLIVDEADRLPEASLQALSYILRNLPGNLRIFLGLRSMEALAIEDLVAYGQCDIVTTSDLGFELEETIELVRQRLGEGIDTDEAVKLHEVAAGWPLGIQLAIGAQMRSRTPASLASRLSGNGSDRRDGFVSLLFANLDVDDVAFLTRISILDDFTLALCEALGDGEPVADQLDHVIRTTPVVQVAERSDWMRIHAMARSRLLERFAELPLSHQVSLHEKAATWLAAHGMASQAARHALAAGNTEWALDLAERSLYESMMTRGQVSQVQNWFAVIPDKELDKRPRLLLAAAWALALSERHGEARRLIDRILSGPHVDDSLRCECDLILGGAAIFADDPDRFAELQDPWAENPPLGDPLLLQIHANRLAFRALLEGEPALARLRQQRAPRTSREQASGYLSRWSEFIIALSYLWEGQVRLTEKIIRPTLLQSDSDLGRRSPFSTMLATLLATASWEQDQPVEAQVLLADRLDVLEKSGLPEALMLGYRTLSRIARSRGDEHRALELLGALDAVGVHRGIPRLCVVSLSEQVRLHARSFRAETCNELVARLDALFEGGTLPTGRLWRRSVAIHRELAHGYAALAARDWRAARKPFEEANSLARSFKQDRVVIETLGLKALALDRCGENVQALLREALELAEGYGLKRVVADAHPMLGDWIRSLGSEGQRGMAAADRVQVPARSAETEAEPPSVPTVNRSTALTPKEWEVLELLARSLSNKEIGRTLDIHEDTVKWHVKNLFAKLDAGSRKQVVSRARLMGFLA